MTSTKKTNVARKSRRFISLLSALLILFQLSANLAARGAAFGDLYDFQGSPDGSTPTGNLVASPTHPDTLYGITTNGGTSGGPYGMGTVYTINASTGVESVIHAFSSTEAHNPVGGLLLVTLSNGAEVLFGCTSGGPEPADLPQIYRIKLAGTPPYPDTFAALPGYGGNQMILASNGYVYGTTNNNGPKTAGSFFRLDPTEAEPFPTTLLYVWSPVGPLLQYGTLNSAPVFYEAGDTNAIFELSKSSLGWTSTLSTTFGGSDPGQSPVGGPVLAGGLMYVPTSSGGAFGLGTISDSTGIADWSFASNAPGYPPEAPLSVGSDGDLYGTTFGNSLYEQGTLFQYDPGPSAAMIRLNSFAQPGATDGLCPDGAPIELSDSSGIWLLGVTEIGGTYADGTIYKGPFP